MPGPDDSTRNRVRVIDALTAHRLMIQAYAYAIVRDHHLAEDVYQEVSTIVATNPSRLPDGPGAVPWLREVARRKALELGRRARRQGPVLSTELTEILAEEFTPDDGRLSRLKEAMAACLRGLEGDAQAIVVGRYVENASCEAIAAHVGRSVQAVYAVLKRVRLRLAHCVRTRVGEAL